MTEKKNFQDFQDLAKREAVSFAKEHLNDNPLELLLHKQRYPDVDVEFAVQQIEGRRTAREKWPSLLQYDDFLYPPRLNREQASSDETAVHKVSVADELCDEGSFLSVADLTGGMGIDSIAFARHSSYVDPLHTQVLAHIDYVERNEELCSLMEHNGKVLGLENLKIHCADSMEWLAAEDRHFDIIFIDPARRSASGRKVAAFEDCVPNILQHIELLRSHCRWLMVKASPMMDIDKGIAQLGNVSDVYVVAVKGECKELLFLCGEQREEPLIHCQNIIPGVCIYSNDPFTRSQEAQAEVVYCTSVGHYIYEPDASLMKGGPYKLLSDSWGLQKLARNTHLYTSNNYHEWMGRTFCVLHEIQLNKKAVAAAIPDGKAHVVTRNYPVAAAELQRQLDLKEGGDLFVIATTVGSQKCGFICCEPKNYQHFLEEINK
ncbi:MAG: class I SAM-dependent methyltransferase [Bacteroidales bacterium]|nr:class I SAM-dependent methyltransferase [Bacteroidales bacterium]